MEPPLLLIPRLQLGHHARDGRVPVAARLLEVVERGEEQAQGIRDAVGGRLVRVEQLAAEGADGHDEGPADEGALDGDDVVLVEAKPAR